MSALARDQGDFGGRQLSLGLYQPNHEYLTSGYFSINYSGEKYLRQEMYPVERMPWVLDQYATKSKKYNSDFYASMATFVGTRRRTALLRDISIIWIDFDYYKTEFFGNFTPERFNALLEDEIIDMGLPLPSFTVASGRGLYANWILDSALPRSALPRWQAVMRELNKKFEMYGADPKACLPTQIMRVVGSFNMRLPQWYPDAERTVRVLSCRTDATGNAERHSFEYLAECILPYTREEVAAYKISRYFERKIYQNYSDNAKALSEHLLSIRKGAISEVRPELRLMIAKDDAAGLWNNRCEAMRKIAKSLGGISDGQGRNDWCWIISNALAWISTKSHLRYDTAEVFKECIPTFSLAEINRSASAISARVNSGEQLYFMRNSILCQKLNITEELLKSNMPKAQIKAENKGVMGFEPIRNLSFDEYLVEKKVRQSKSAVRTNEIKSENCEISRATARLMRSRGGSIRYIAKHLSVGKSTVQRWCC